MSYVGLVNQSATTSFPMHVYRLVVQLVASGVWSVVGSGDGLALFQNQGQTAGPFNVITNGNSGAGGLANANAWVRVQDTNGREVVFRIVNTSTFAWSYSRVGGFSSGASSTVIPTASDSAAICTSMNITALNCLTHVVVQNAAINGVFGWYLMSTVTGTGVRNFFIAMEPLEPGVNGSQVFYGDDPVVFFNMNNDPTQGSVGVSSPTIPPQSFGNICVAVYREGQPDRLVVGVSGYIEMNDNGTALFPNGMNVNQYSGNDDRCRITFGRAAAIAYPFVKGVSAAICWKGIAARQYPDTLDLASASPRVYFGDLVVPWLTGITPTV